MKGRMLGGLGLILTILGFVVSNKKEEEYIDQAVKEALAKEREETKDPKKTDK